MSPDLSKGPQEAATLLCNCSTQLTDLICAESGGEICQKREKVHVLTSLWGADGLSAHCCLLVSHLNPLMGVD